MNDIQVDMFEVQLGAALLLQFRTETGEIVRVLADAGVSASGYSLDHVLKKLPDAIQSFGGETSCLNLMIGTHYDADHLEGLVSVIQDPSIEIGEAWMPPVANDLDPHAANDPVQEHHLLGYQFMQEDGESILLSYLNHKKDICEELRFLENSAADFRGEIYLNKKTKPTNDFTPSKETRLNIDSYVRHFQDHLNDANFTLDISDCCHADDDFHESSGIMLKKSLFWRRNFFPWWDDYTCSNKEKRKSFFLNRWQSSSNAADSDARNMAFIRQAAAKDAINATSLYKVVTALKQRRIPTHWHMIQDGQPRRFVWRSGRFIPGTQLSSNGPEIKLMGPSEGLVKKHWNRLPVGSYLAYLAMMDIPIKGITPSNQLSYIMRIGFKEQGILVTGDAGFVDAKSGNTKNYYPGIIQALLPLHLIQVAHHGGNNAHFYRVLLTAGYPAENYPSWLLLSHATHDKFRPSKEFSMFIEQVRRDGDDIKLLFTSEPSESKVRDFKTIINPLAGVSTNAPVGDIRVIFCNTKWVVKKHAIQVN